MSPEPGVYPDHIISAIRIEYQPDSPDPARVFRSMTKLIDAFGSLDQDLASTISVGIRPIHVLHDVETGSLIAWLKTTLNLVDDDALKSLEWKPLVGQFLVRGKDWILDWLEKHDTANNVAELEELRQDLLDEATSTDVAAFPQYSAIPMDKLLEDLSDVGDALSELSPDDSVEIISESGSQTVNHSFRLSRDQIENLLTEEIVLAEQDITLLIKRPDYLGKSMWQFHYDGHSLDAKIEDEAWLERFQNRELDVRPGDAIRARVHVQEHRSKSGQTVSARYTVKQVFEIIRASEPGSQLQMPSGDDEG